MVKSRDNNCVVSICFWRPEVGESWKSWIEKSVIREKSEERGHRPSLGSQSQTRWESLVRYMPRGMVGLKRESKSEEEPKWMDGWSTTLAIESPIDIHHHPISNQTTINFLIFQIPLNLGLGQETFGSNLKEVDGDVWKDWCKEWGWSGSTRAILGGHPRWI